MYYNPPFSCFLDAIYRIYGMGGVILSIQLILSEFPFWWGYVAPRFRVLAGRAGTQLPLKLRDEIVGDGVHRHGKGA